MKQRMFKWIAIRGLKAMIWIGLKFRKCLSNWAKARIFFVKLTGQRFYCRALAGDSDYNISINSDLTLSCNCQDYDGTGYLGDLSSHSLEEIMNGPIARQFRQLLAEGKSPTSVCMRCGELRWAPKQDLPMYSSPVSIPKKGLMLENTSRCNLACISCERPLVTKIRKRDHLSLEEIRKISLGLQRDHIETVYFFKLGEPFLSPDIYDELKILREDNPALKIITATNGALIDSDRKREACLFLEEIIFSIDGMSDETVRKYQRGGSFETAYQNMKALVAYRDSKGLRTPVIEWKYVLFNWNDKHDMLMKAIALAEEARIDILSFWPTLNPPEGISWRYYFGNILGEAFETVLYNHPHASEIGAIAVDLFCHWYNVGILPGTAWFYKSAAWISRFWRNDFRQIGQGSWKGREIRFR